MGGNQQAGKLWNTPKCPGYFLNPEKHNAIAPLARKALLSVVNVRGSGLPTTTADLGPESFLPPCSPLRNLRTRQTITASVKLPDKLF